MISDKMRAAACKAINDRGKGNNVTIPDINAMLSAAMAAAEPIGIRCTGCGMPWDDDRLAAEKAKKPGLISCCPERKMVPVYTAPPISAAATNDLDWSGFQGIKINREWMPDDQELIYTALGVYEGEGDMDDDAKEQIIERLLAAWQLSSLSARVKDAPAPLVKSTGSDWLKHNGKTMPVNGSTRVEVRLANGVEYEPDFAQNWLARSGSKSNWHHDAGTKHPCDIVEYRIVTPSLPAVERKDG